MARLRNSKYDYSDYLRKNLSALDPEVRNALVQSLNLPLTLRLMTSVSLGEVLNWSSNGFDHN